MKNIFLLALMIFSGQVFGQTSLSGKVTEGYSGSGAVFANVELYKGTDLVTSTQTDFDGLYHFANLDSGTYNVEVSYIGYSPIIIEHVILYASEANNLDFSLEECDVICCGVVKYYKVPLIKLDQTTSGATFSAGDLRRFYHGSLFSTND